MLSLLRAQVQSLIGELRFHKPHGMAKKKKAKTILRPHMYRKRHQAGFGTQATVYRLLIETKIWQI